MGYLSPKRNRVWLRGAIVWYSWNMLNPRGVGWVHAGPRGGILTKEDVRWWNINGIFIRTRNTQTFLHFRRLPWYLVPGR